MNDFLFLLKEQVVARNTKGVNDLLNKNIDTPIPLKDFIEFTRMFATRAKAKITGCININGTGASGMKKPNISSIAALYVSQLSETPVVKTGSVYNTSFSGSSNFFYDIGYSTSTKREEIFERYRFGYYDYLELSPWKRYSHILARNKSITSIYEKAIFFDYISKIYLLGISRPSYYHAIQQKTLIENKPNKLVTFYTMTHGKVVDEIVPGTVFVDNKLVSNQEQGFYYKKINSKEEVQKINRKLLHGEETGYWKAALSMTCAYTLLEIGRVASIEEGEEVFEEAYKNRVVKRVLDACEV